MNHVAIKTTLNCHNFAMIEMFLVGNWIFLRQWAKCFLIAIKLSQSLDQWWISNRLPSDDWNVFNFVQKFSHQSFGHVIWWLMFLDIIWKFWTMILFYLVSDQNHFNHWSNGGDWTIVDRTIKCFWAVPKNFLGDDPKNLIIQLVDSKFLVA
jgi:hypothetical protein